MSYGAVEKQVHGGAVAEGEGDIDLRHFLQSNTAPYERLDDHDEEDMTKKTTSTTRPRGTCRWMIWMT